MCPFILSTLTFNCRLGVSVCLSKFKTVYTYIYNVTLCIILACACKVTKSPDNKSLILDKHTIIIEHYCFTACLG